MNKYHEFLEEYDITCFEEILLYLSDNDMFFTCHEDTENDLIMFSINEDTNIDDKYFKILNGLIVNKTDISLIICCSGIYVNNIELDELHDKFDFNLNNLKFEVLTDFVYIRLYYYADKWLISTLNNIRGENELVKDFNTFNIRELFQMFCEFNYFDYKKKLNKNNVYLMSLQYNHNINKPELIHWKTFNIDYQEIEHSLYLPSPKEVEFKNLKNLIDTCKLSKHTTKGFMITDLKNNLKYNLLTTLFMYSEYIRGKETDIVKKFIHLKRDELLDEYIQYFPYHTEIMNLLTKIFDWHTQYYYKSYVDIHIFKISKTDNLYKTHEKTILSKIHSIYADTRVSTTIEVVETVLLYTPYFILKDILNINN